jgi:hypothetical protein
MSDTTGDPGRTLGQLAATLRLAAERLADTAGRLPHAAEHQQEQLAQLRSLRDRIADLLAACGRLTDSAEAPNAPPAPQTLNAAPGLDVPGLAGLPARTFVEFTTAEEFEKFRRLGPITADEVAACDVDDLIRRLHADTE